MSDGPLTVRVNLAVVDTIRSKGNEFVTGVIKATGELKLYESLGLYQLSIQLYKKTLII